MRVTMLQLREALEKSWNLKTAYSVVAQRGNPALGQCYPTARVVQFYFPETEIVEGEVWTGKSFEKHFWNLLEANGEQYHIDLTWQQFPHDSIIKNWKIRDRKTLGDSRKTINRVDLLKNRVKDYLSKIS